ncbi:MAG: aminotransferase class V-fold PLP-dependent enzyme [Acidobacteriota bacterium]|jgi:selenocysteine lyase/cysteine desulfurase|nr:aminotransferase class V-fold PLP-dependent enzyme [Acidobacteriota bacterium]
MQPDALTELTAGVFAALRVYANVHRGSGHFSQVSTALYEEARQVVQRHSGRNPKRYTTIFCSAHAAEAILKKVNSGDCSVFSSEELGLPLGISALVIRKRDLPGGTPPRTGGGVVKLVAKNSVVWSAAPERYEAGTPAVINTIAFAKALQLMGKYGESAFRNRGHTDLSVKDVFDKDGFDGLRGKELLDRLRDHVIGKDIHVPTDKGSLVYANLDHAASTPALTPVWDVFRTVLSIPSAHRSALIDAARKICHGFLHAPQTDYDIFFTANTTDSLNIAAASLYLNENPGTETVVLNTMLEHHSNELVWRCNGQVTLRRLSVDSGGFLDPSMLEKTLNAYNEQCLFGKKRIRLVAVCGVSNVLGSVQNLDEISGICHTFGVQLLVDAAQAAVHRQINMQGEGIDILALSGHKMYAPFGAGVLAIRKGLLDYSAGAALRQREKENAAGIAALGKAMQLLQRVGLETIASEEHELTQMLVKGLTENRDIQTHGITDGAAPRFRNRAGIVVFGLKRTPHNRVVKELAEKGGIGVRNGCFCAHIIVKDLLHIHPFREKLAEWLLLFLPGLAHPSSLLPGLVRVSLGIANDEQDVRRLLDVLREIARTPRSRVDRFIASKHNGTPFMRRTATQKAITAFVCKHVREVFESPGGGS